MKKLMLSVAIISVIFSCSNGKNSDDLSTDLINNPNSANETNVDKDKLPFFEFEEEVVNFGTITQGEIVSTSFKFKNVGKSDLIISSAQGSCGCTIPEWPKEPIKPGENAKIAVTFNSTGKQGLQNKTITIVSNTIPNTKVIALKGEVLVPKGKENESASE